MPKELVRKRGKRKPKSDPAPAVVVVAAAPPAGPTASTSTALPAAAGDGRDAGYGQRAARHAALEQAAYGPEGSGELPSWVTPADGGLGSIRERVEGDAPWGFVDPEVRLALCDPAIPVAQPGSKLFDRGADILSNGLCRSRLTFGPSTRN